MNYQTVLNLRVSLVVLALVLIFVLSPVLVASFDAWNKSACDYKEIPAFYWTFTNVGHCAAIKTIGVASISLAFLIILFVSITIVYVLDPGELLYKLKQMFNPRTISVAELIQRYEKLERLGVSTIQALVDGLDFAIGYAFNQTGRDDIRYAISYEYLGQITILGELASDIDLGFRSTATLVIKNFAQKSDLTISITCTSQTEVRRLIVDTCHKVCKDYNFNDYRISSSQIPYIKTP